MTTAIFGKEGADGGEHRAGAERQSLRSRRSARREEPERPADEKRFFTSPHWESVGGAAVMGTGSGSAGDGRRAVSLIAARQQEADQAGGGNHQRKRQRKTKSARKAAAASPADSPVFSVRRDRAAAHR